MPRLVTALTALLALRVASLPSCDSETEANCVGEDADLSPEGISACLAALADKSDSCVTYLKLMECAHGGARCCGCSSTALTTLAPLCGSQVLQAGPLR